MAHLLSAVNGRVVPAPPAAFENLYPVDAAVHALGGVAGTYGLSNVPADSLFAAGDHDAVIRSIHVNYSANNPVPRIQIFRASDDILVYELQNLRASPHSAIFGPEGFRVAGGFYIQVLDSPASFAVAFDVT